MNLQEAKEKLQEIAKEMEFVYKVQSIEEVARKRCLLSARMIEFTLLYENLAIQSPDLTAKTKQVQAQKESEYRAQGKNCSDSKNEAYLDAFESDLSSKEIKAKVNIASRYLDAIKENLNALAALQKALTEEKVNSN